MKLPSRKIEPLSAFVHGALGAYHALGAAFHLLEEDKDRTNYGMIAFHVTALVVDGISLKQHLQRD